MGLIMVSTPLSPLPVRLANQLGLPGTVHTEAEQLPLALQKLRDRHRVLLCVGKEDGLIDFLDGLKQRIHCLSSGIAADFRHGLGDHRGFQ